MPKEVKKRDRAQYWPITWFYPEGQDRMTAAKAFYDYVDAKSKDALWEVKYYVGQVEVCPTTKREHVQGYVEFDRQICWDKARKAFIPGCHFEPRRKTEKANTRYCSKDDTSVAETRFIFGAPVVTVEKTDPKELIALVKKGQMSIDDVKDNEPAMYIRFHRIIEPYYQEALGQKEDWVVKSVIFRCGPSTVGKSTAARNRLKELTGMQAFRPTQYNHNLNMSGYKRGQALMLDEFKASTIDFELLNDLLRPVCGVRLQFNCKGASPPQVYVDPEHVEIVSNYTLSAVFGSGQRSLNFINRVTSFIYHTALVNNVPQFVEFKVDPLIPGHADTVYREFERSIEMYSRQNPHWWTFRDCPPN